MAGNPLMNMMMKNNPIMQMANMLKNGNGNPQAMINMLLQKNPQVAQIVQNMNGKSPDQIGEMVRNIAQERGMDLGQVIGDIGVPQEVISKYHINGTQEMKQDQTNNA